MLGVVPAKLDFQIFGDRFHEHPNRAPECVLGVQAREATDRQGAARGLLAWRWGCGRCGGRLRAAIGAPVGRASAAGRVLSGPQAVDDRAEPDREQENQQRAYPGIVLHTLSAV